jgi:hypothetical protein
MKTIIFTTISALVLFTACTHKTELTHQTRTPQQVDEYAQQHTAYLKEMTVTFSYMGLPIPAVTEHPGSGHLTITFGKLTSAQFEAAKKKFSYAKLPAQFLPTYNPNRSYEMTDFLPPKAQALMNKRTSPGIATEMPKWFQKYSADYLNGYAQTGLMNYTNCWGTVHDVLLSSRFPNVINLFNIDSINDKYYRNPQFFKRIDPKNIRPYDVVLQYDDYAGSDKTIQHAALYLGNYLVFQKDGLDETNHYRITLFKEGRTGREFYRPKEGVAIQTPEELFGMKNPKISPALAAELKDPVKMTFFKSLILVPQGQGVADPFLMSNSVKLPLIQNPQTGRYEFNNKTFPGNQVIAPLPKKFIEY